MKSQNNNFSLSLINYPTELHIIFRGLWDRVVLIFLPHRIKLSMLIVTLRQSLFFKYSQTCCDGVIMIYIIWVAGCAVKAKWYKNINTLCNLCDCSTQLRIYNYFPSLPFTNLGYFYLKALDFAFCLSFNSLNCEIKGIKKAHSTIFPRTENEWSRYRCLFVGSCRPAVPRTFFNSISSHLG